MNEPANFCTGEVCRVPPNHDYSFEVAHLPTLNEDGTIEPTESCPLQCWTREELLEALSKGFPSGEGGEGFPGEGEKERGEGEKERGEGERARDELLLPGGVGEEVVEDVRRKVEGMPDPKYKVGEWVWK